MQDNSVDNLLATKPYSYVHLIIKVYLPPLKDYVRYLPDNARLK